MSKEINKTLLSLIELHEGYRRYPYHCTSGKLTIGIGRNIQDVGISRNEAEFLLHGDVIKARKDAAQFKWYSELSEPRQHAILNMLLNLGLPKFLRFRHMINALEKHDYEKAAAEAMDSTWAKQVKGRAHDIVNLILYEEYPSGVKDEQ